MDLGEQTLHYYLKVFKIVIIVSILVFSLFIYYILNKSIILKSNTFIIEKGDNLEVVINKNINNISFLDKFFIKIYYKINNVVFNKFFHFGEFYLPNNSSINDLLSLIYKPGNVLNKITIVEGWSKKELHFEISKYFKNIHQIPFESIIADTYYFDRNENFHSFVEKMNIIKEQYFNNIRDHQLLNEYNIEEIMIIGSLLEKEGLDADDKRKISSVIFNRLNNNMKLQLDATVMYAITEGSYNLERNLFLSDLKIDHPYNTYINHGLPPKPISYVGKKTLDIIFENYKTDFMFYFFNYSLRRHIFSKNYKDHIKKLNEYRNNK